VWPLCYIKNFIKSI